MRNCKRYSHSQKFNNSNTDKVNQWSRTLISHISLITILGAALASSARSNTVGGGAGGNSGTGGYGDGGGLNTPAMGGSSAYQGGSGGWTNNNGTGGTASGGGQGGTAGAIDSAAISVNSNPVTGQDGQISGGGGVGIFATDDVTSLINNSSATGGNGGNSTDVNSGGSGGGGGAGVVIPGMFTNNAESSVQGGNGGNSVKGDGGGGGAGVIASSTTTNISTINGGAGGIGISGGGGGVGLAGTTSNTTLSNYGNINGGNGGIGKGNPATNPQLPGNGGGGGAAIVTNADVRHYAGNIIGGNGAIGADKNGLGGPGILLTSPGSVVQNNSLIAGGFDGTGTIQANAITFTGDNNNFIIVSGSSTQGNVVVIPQSGSTTAPTDNTISLAPNSNEVMTFDVSTIGSTNATPYQGFQGLGKTPGSGTVNLIGSNPTLFLDVDYGVINLQGATVGDVTSQTIGTGTLTGIGTVGNIAGTFILSPGNSPGTIRGTNYMPSAGGVFNTAIQPSAAPIAGVDNSLLALTGTADVRNAILTITPAAGNYSNNSQYTIITTGDNGVTGPFASAPTTAGPYKVNYTYNANSIVLGLESLALHGDTPDEQATANIINAADMTGQSDLWKLVDGLNKLNQSSIDNALDAIDPERNTDVGYQTMVGSALSNGITGVRLEALRNASTGGGTAAAAFSDGGRTASQNMQNLQALNGHRGDTMQGLAVTSQGLQSEAKQAFEQQLINSKGQGGVWLHTFGKQDRQRSSVDNYGYRNNSVGAMAGLDYKIRPDMFVGGGFELSQGKFTMNEDGGDGRIRSYSWLGYGTYYQGPMHIDLSLVASLNHYHINRKINIPTMATRIANSHHKGYSFTPHVGAGYKIPLTGFVLEPFGGVDYVFQNQQGYRETGAQSLNFNVQSKRSRFLRGETGANIIKTYKEPNYQLQFIAKLSYVYRQAWNANDISANLNGQSEILNIRNETRKQHLISPGVEGTWISDDKLSIGLAYNAEIGARYNSQQATIKIGKRF